MAKANKDKTVPAEVVAAQLPEEVATQPVQEVVQLTIIDLQAVASVIDLASQRGAFRAAELVEVGNAYNKLATFLQFVAAQQSVDQPTE